MDTVDKIFSVLEEKNYSQQFLADALGIDKSTLSAWKSGKTKSYIKYIDKISKLLDVSKDWLLGKSDVREVSNCQKMINRIKENKILDEIIKNASKDKIYPELMELDDEIRNRIKSNIVYYAAKEGDTFVTALQKIKITSSFADSLNHGGAVFMHDLRTIAKHYNVNFNLFVGADLTFETGRNLAKLLKNNPLDKNKADDIPLSDNYIILMEQGYCPSALFIRSIADAYGVDVIDLPIPYNELCSIFDIKIGITENEITALRKIRKLSPKGKQLVENYLNDVNEIYGEK